MKKILLIGRFNTITKNINRLLSKFFDVQLSSDNIEIAKGMLQIGSYHLIVINMVGWDKEKTAIFKEIRKQCPKISIVCIGEDTEVVLAQDHLPLEMVRVIKRPILNKHLLDTICMVLGVHIEYKAGEVEEVEEIEAEKNDETKRGKKHVLLVDDSPIQLRTLREILKDKYEVSVATSGGAAMVIVGKKVPDLIVLDYEMPVCNGKMVFEILRSTEETKNIPVVFLTGLNDKEHIKDVLSLNPEGYLLKPVSQERILQTIENIIGE